VFQSSEIYGGINACWDYGPLGIQLKLNIKNAWWKLFVTDREEMYGLDAALLMNAKVWEASGHVAGFADPLVECTKCKRRFRADQLESDKCPDCGGALGEARQFNMMFSTKVGAMDDSAATAYLRPETAQGIFVNFKNVVDSFHPKLPFGIAQIGKAFRNEITPRDFIFRVRELEQMEVEYFTRETDFDKLLESARENEGGAFTKKMRDILGRSSEWIKPETIINIDQRIETWKQVVTNEVAVENEKINTIEKNWSDFAASGELEQSQEYINAKQAIESLSKEQLTNNSGPNSWRVVTTKMQAFDDLIMKKSSEFKKPIEELRMDIEKEWVGSSKSNEINELTALYDKVANFTLNQNIRPHAELLELYKARTQSLN
jgi:hypothetical protein